MLLGFGTIAAALCGISLHLGHFIHGEHHMQSVTIFRLALATPIAVFLACLKMSGFNLRAASVTSATILCAFAGSLLASITIYRSLFQRTRKFPGPKLAGITKLYHMWNVMWKSNQYQWLETMHQRYGDFVRTGMALVDSIVADLQAHGCKDQTRSRFLLQTLYLLFMVPRASAYGVTFTT